MQVLTTRLTRLALFLFVALGTFASSPVARAQSSPPPQTAGIPGSVMLQPGDSVTFSNGSVSLSVVYQFVSGATIPVSVADASLTAKVAYDGTALSIGVPAMRYAQIDVQPPDDRSCAAVNGLANAARCTVAASPTRSPVSFIIAGGPRPIAPCPDVQLPASWNLISGGLGQDINANVGPFYTFAPSQNQYQAVTDARALQEQVGYWVYFDQPTTVFDFDVSSFGGCPGLPPPPGPVASPSPVSFGLTPGQLVMVGNPFLRGTVTGADAVWTYDPTNGYQETQTLTTGQAAWVYSANGGIVTIAPTGS